MGSSFDSNFNWSHGLIWENGTMTDLNTLFPASSNLYVISASNINESGQISGMAMVLAGPHAGNIHAFLATPVNESMGKSVADVAAHTRKSLCPRMLASSFCRDSDSANSAGNGIRFSRVCALAMLGSISRSRMHALVAASRHVAEQASYFCLRANLCLGEFAIAWNVRGVVPDI